MGALHNARPVGEYPTMTAAALAMQAQGASIAEIAEHLDRDQNSVRALIAMSRKRRTVRQMPKGLPGLTDFFGSKYVESLRPFAERRQLTVDQLIKTLVRTIAHDKLVDAVLDDRRHL